MLKSSSVSFIAHITRSFYGVLQELVDHCGQCGKEVKGEIIRITGAVFHPDCFSCEVTLIVFAIFFISLFHETKFLF